MGSIRICSINNVFYIPSTMKYPILTFCLIALFGFAGCQSIHVGGSGNIGGISGGGGISIPVPRK